MGLGLLLLMSTFDKPQHDEAYEGDYYDNHIMNVRYGVPNVNERLAKHIPSDVHYVSYHPKCDKAVYCYYHPNHKSSGGQIIAPPDFSPLSRCYFVALKDGLLTKYDISDLIRANLMLYYHQTKQDIYVDYAYVEAWVDREDLMFGMFFVVNPAFHRYGVGDYY